MDSAINAADMHDSGQQVHDVAHAVVVDHVHAGQGGAHIVDGEDDVPDHPTFGEDYAHVDALGEAVNALGEVTDALSGVADALGEVADALGEKADALGGVFDALGDVINALNGVTDALDGVTDASGEIHVAHVVHVGCEINHAGCEQLVDVGPYAHTYLLYSHLTAITDHHQLQVVGPSLVCAEGICNQEDQFLVVPEEWVSEEHVAEEHVPSDVAVVVLDADQLCAILDSSRLVS